MVQLLETRDGVFRQSVNKSKLLTRVVEERLYPAWDIATAAHVLSSGSYRLLPRTIEHRLGVPRPITQELVESTVSRLSDKLRIRLLSEVIPAAFTSIRVGEFWLIHSCLCYIATHTDR